MKPFDYFLMFLGAGSFALLVLSLREEVIHPHTVQLAKSLNPKRWAERESRQRKWIVFGLLCFAAVIYRRWG
jgi:hypothetical protein